MSDAEDKDSATETPEPTPPTEHEEPTPPEVTEAIVGGAPDGDGGSLG